MHIAVRADHLVLTHTLRSFIEERLAFALAWTGRQTLRLNVMLSCNTGPRGEVLQCCKIQLHHSDGRTFVIEDIKSDVHLAVERAASRIDRAIRHVKRQRFMPTAQQGTLTM